MFPRATNKSIMQTRTLLTIAARLRKPIGAHAALIGTGCAQSTYLEARNASDSAESLARYLAQHLNAPRAQREIFAKACGLGSHIVKD
jgi:hypothetical protein